MYCSPPITLQVRCAGAVWLVSLLTYCGRHPALLPRLADIQEALSGLLGDANELTQVGRLRVCVRVCVCMYVCVCVQCRLCEGESAHVCLYVSVCV